MCDVITLRRAELLTFFTVVLIGVEHVAVVALAGVRAARVDAHVLTAAVVHRALVAI